jgi:transcriptional regulator
MEDKDIIINKLKADIDKLNNTIKLKDTKIKELDQECEDKSDDYTIMVKNYLELNSKYVTLMYCTIIIYLSIIYRTYTKTDSLTEIY